MPMRSWKTDKIDPVFTVALVGFPRVFHPSVPDHPLYTPPPPHAKPKYLLGAP